MAEAGVLNGYCVDGMATREGQHNRGPWAHDTLAVPPATRCYPEAQEVDKKMLGACNKVIPTNLQSGGC